ncbi:MAG: tRNA 2-thiouridine(34) synthase MnmA, partial [Acidimicrobiales bacterium]|nr:tRNA 2-thiouridine(34) synthase MnmA [Acidimicrobiales bacterium]
CIECNRHLKFDALLRRAEALGFDRVATGHHARVVVAADGRRRVGRGADRAKDQSYVLHVLDQDALGRVLFPVGELGKAGVRADAARLGLRTAAKPDSQDVCFITSAGGRRAFLGERIPLRPAEVRDARGTVVGRTEAVELVTIGQRKGLGLAGGTSPRYVVDVSVPDVGDGATPVVTVGARHDLLVDTVALDGLAWSAGPVAGPVQAQCSAHGAPATARVEGATVRWDRPQRRVARGQSVVLYVDDLVVGGGFAA